MFESTSSDKVAVHMHQVPVARLDRVVG